MGLNDSYSLQLLKNNTLQQTVQTTVTLNLVLPVATRWFTLHSGAVLMFNRFLRNHSRLFQRSRRLRKSTRVEVLELRELLAVTLSPQDLDRPTATYVQGEAIATFTGSNVTIILGGNDYEIIGNSVVLRNTVSTDFDSPLPSLGISDGSDQKFLVTRNVVIQDDVEVGIFASVPRARNLQEIILRNYSAADTQHLGAYLKVDLSQIGLSNADTLANADLLAFGGPSTRAAATGNLRLLELENATWTETTSPVGNSSWTVNSSSGNGATAADLLYTSASPFASGDTLVEGLSADFGVASVPTSPGQLVSFDLPRATVEKGVVAFLMLTTDTVASNLYYISSSEHATNKPYVSVSYVTDSPIVINNASVDVLEGANSLETPVSLIPVSGLPGGLTEPRMEKVNGVTWSALPASQHNTFTMDAGYRQASGTYGTLYVASDGTAFYEHNGQNLPTSAHDAFSFSVSALSEQTRLVSGTRNLAVSIAAANQAPGITVQLNHVTKTGDDYQVVNSLTNATTLFSSALPLVIATYSLSDPDGDVVEAQWTNGNSPLDDNGLAIYALDKAKDQITLTDSGKAWIRSGNSLPPITLAAVDNSGTATNHRLAKVHPVVAHGRSIYVSQSGSGTLDGSSPQNTLALENALQRTTGNISQYLQPGDTVFLVGSFANQSYQPTFQFSGTQFADVANPALWHNEKTIWIYEIFGTYELPITFTSYNSDTLLKGDGAAIVEVKSSRYVRLLNLDVQGQVQDPSRPGEGISLDTAKKLQMLYQVDKPDTTANKNKFGDQLHFNDSATGNSYYFRVYTQIAADLGLARPAGAQLWTFDDLLHHAEAYNPQDASTWMFDIMGAASDANASVARPSIIDTKGINVHSSYGVDVIGAHVRNMPGTGIQSYYGAYLNFADNEVHDSSRLSYTGTHGMQFYYLGEDNTSIFPATDPYAADPDSHFNIDSSVDYKLMVTGNSAHHNYNGQFSWNTAKMFVEPKIDEGKGISPQFADPRDKVSGVNAWSQDNDRLLLANNVLFLNGLAGIHNHEVSRVDIVNNTAYLNSLYQTVFRVPYSANSIGITHQGGTDINIHNNISVIRDRMIDGSPVPTSPITTTNGAFAYEINATSDLLWALDGSVTVDPSLTSTAINKSAARQFISNSDPNFASPAGEQFSLLGTSPAINVGVRWNGALATDKYGVVRDNTPDLGAFEFKEFSYTSSGGNLAPTDISITSRNIPENAMQDTPVGTLSTADSDVGDTFTYTLVSGTGSDANALFNINGNVLRASAIFDFELASTYPVRIRTTDRGGLFFEKPFLIEVTNVNEAPSILSISGLKITEGSSLNSTVGVFATADPDHGDTFSYSLISGSGDTNNASFTIDGNQLKTNASMDYAAKDSYSIRVQSVDSGGLTTSKAFNVFVIPAEGLHEGNIHFVLDSDNDGVRNSVDTDDDNDGVPDNDDYRPLDGSVTQKPLLTETVSAVADAPTQSNTSSKANQNFGAAATAETKNYQRDLLIKFSVPAGLDIVSASLNVSSSTEDDPIDVFELPDSSWVESTVTANSVNLTGLRFLGTTSAPTSQKYSFNLPDAAVPSSGATVSYMVLDWEDPDGSVEYLYTKETPGKAPTLTLRHYAFESPLISLTTPAGMVAFADPNSPISVGVRLTMQPAERVYVPFSTSASNIAAIAGDSVLIFDATNWDQPQYLQVTAISPGDFTVKALPLHSNDANFNGVNPPDLSGLRFQSARLTNFSDLTAVTGNQFTRDLTAVSMNGSSRFEFKVLEAPAGFSVVEHTGRITFRPTSGQVGTFPITIQVTDELGLVSEFSASITVTSGQASDLAGYYVVPEGGNDAPTSGSSTAPFNSIAYAVQRAAANGVSTVYIRGGDFTLSAAETISTAASSPITIKPLPGEHVHLRFRGRVGFEITSTARNIIFDGLEIDGEADIVDYWDILSQGYWDNSKVQRGGGIAFNVNGQDIVISNNVIHDAYQKAVNIQSGRYVAVTGNVIYNIANTSLSGGHGIMRQQGYGGFSDADVPGKFRWDISENLIFNVEQRIYSWVQSKGYLNMVLDEGKPILIDEPSQNDEVMTARISNNVVAYGAIDGIVLKSTPGLQVTNNSVFSNGSHADGITDRNESGLFSGFVFQNNAVQTAPGTFAIDIQDAVADGDFTVSGNVFSGGSSKTSSGMTGYGNASLFTNALEGDFSLSATVDSNAGISPAVLSGLNQRAADNGVAVAWSGWITDELKITQTLLDNIPGVYDAVAGNETVFTNAGNFAPSNRESGRLALYVDVVNGSWKSSTGSAATQEIILPAAYGNWLSDVNTDFKRAPGVDYTRIRWGGSVIAQDFNFDSSGLLVSEIESSNRFSTIEARSGAVVLDGDLLVRFADGFVPQPGSAFDLVVADALTSANQSGVFDRVLFSGHTPTAYEVSIVQDGGYSKLRLAITGSGTTNNPPTSVDLSGNTIAENLGSDGIVGILSTIDPDAGDTFTYSLVTGTGSDDNSSFNISGETLRATNSLDFEAKSSYSVRVRSTDQGGLAIERVMTIFVSNVNEQPSDLNLTSSIVNENEPAGTVVGTLIAVDPDAANTFSWTLVAGTGSTNNASFSIQGSELRTQAVFDFESQSSYSIRVRVEDQGGLAIERVMTILVSNVNEQPTDLSVTSSTVNENQPSGTVVGILNAVDPDAANTFSWTLVAGTGSTNNASFSIQGSELRTQAVFDFESKSSYSVRVRAEDQHGLWFEKSLVITVGNVDDTNPRSVVGDVPTPTSRVIPISVTAADPGLDATGVATVGLYYSTGGAYTWFATLTPGNLTAQWTVPATSTTYWVRSLAVDVAGNSESKTGYDIVVTVGDVDRPVTQISSVTSDDFGKVVLAMSGTRDGRAKLQEFVVYSSIDGGVATEIGRVSSGVANGSGVYSAELVVQLLADNTVHSWTFYTVGIDSVGNVESAPVTPDVSLNRSFSPAPLRAIDIDVQLGMQQRSYVRYLDVLFSSESGVSSLADSSRVRVEKFALNTESAAGAVAGTGTNIVASALTAVNSRLRLDFGSTGLGGLRQNGDGFYRVRIDMDGDGSFGDPDDTEFEFFRLFGDVNGDGVVDVADTNLVGSQLGRTGSGLEADCDGNGVVNTLDRQFSIQRRGRTLRTWMFGWLDD